MHSIYVASRSPFAMRMVSAVRQRVLVHLHEVQRLKGLLADMTLAQKEAHTLAYIAIVSQIEQRSSYMVDTISRNMLT